jgi:hypothetical protein
MNFYIMSLRRAETVAVGVNRLTPFRDYLRYFAATASEDNIYDKG